MKKINSLRLEQGMVSVINEAKRGNHIILMNVDGFITDTEAVYLRDMLWYAKKNGVVIEFVPLLKHEVPTNNSSQENS